jgi:hypothetical protein
VLGIDVACVAALGWAVWWRLSLTANPLGRATGMLALAVLPLLTVVFVLAGPLRPGWARRAGTPVPLLGSRATASSPAVAQGRQVPLVNARFTGNVAVSSGPAAGQRTIRIVGHTTVAPERSFVIVLHGVPSGGGVALSDGTVRIGGPGTRDGYSGPVLRLAQHELIAAVTGPDGQRTAQFDLTVSGSVATGTVSLLAAAEE